MLNKRWMRILTVAALLLIVLGGGFIVWASITNPILPAAQEALVDGSAVDVTQESWITFSPADQTPTTGLIFYPGGRVDPRAYAPTMHALAQQGYLAVITPMPLNLAVLNSGAASAVMEAHPAVENWALAGHSLGAAMGAAYTADHPTRVAGLALLAGYPAASSSLAALDIPVISIYGTQDGLATPADIEAARSLLPPDTRYVRIEGGNHAGFGYYGAQNGDNPATISRDAQQAQTIDALLSLLETIDS